MNANSGDNLFSRDDSTGALLCIDNVGLKAYKLQKKKTAEMTDDINNLKKECMEIRNLLETLIQKFE